MTCDHANQRTRVASHKDLIWANDRGIPHASTYTCQRRDCIENAARWVRRVTGRDAVIVPMVGGTP